MHTGPTDKRTDWTDRTDEPHERPLLCARLLVVGGMPLQTPRQTERERERERDRNNIRRVSGNGGSSRSGFGGAGSGILMEVAAQTLLRLFRR